EANLPESVLPQTGSFTIEAWIITTTGGTIVEYYEGGGAKVGESLINFYFDSTTVTFDLRAATGDVQTIVGNKSVTDGQPHHLMIGRSIEENTIFLFIDGVAFSSPLKVTGRIGDEDGETDPFIIGASRQCCGQIPEYTDFFKGIIDEVRIYRRALPL